MPGEPGAAGNCRRGLGGRGPRTARIILGGNNPSSGTYDTNVLVKGLPSVLGTTVHATVWGIDSSGLNASTGPYVVKEGDFTASGGQATIPLTGLKGTSAYQVILTPDTERSVATAGRYEAEYAALGGTAKVTYGTNTGYSGTYFVEGYGASSTAST